MGLIDSPTIKPIHYASHHSHLRNLSFGNHHPRTGGRLESIVE